MISELRTLHIPSNFVLQKSDWKWGFLEDLCEGVFDCPHSTPEIASSGPLMARSQDMRSGVFRANEAAHVSLATFEERIRRAKPTFGDLLYSREGTYFGIAAEVPENLEICLGQRMVLIRPKKNQLNFRYLKYWLNSNFMQNHIQGQKEGTVAERLNLPTIRQLPILLPPINIQIQIGKFLGSLDDKIEINNRMNEVLEKMVRATFKEWFVDFGPVKSKALGKIPFGIDNKIAALFPDTFEDSVFGKIPKGWKPSKYGDIMKQHKLTVTPARVGFNDCIHYSLPNFDAGKFPKFEKMTEIKSNKFRVPNDSILFSKLNPRTPRVWIANHSKEQNSIAVGSTEFVVIEPASDIHRWLSYCLLTESVFLERMSQTATGTSNSHQRIRPETIFETQWINPGIPVIEAFNNSVKHLFELSLNNIKEIQSLIQARDLLLPKLVSGEIDAKELK